MTADPRAAPCLFTATRCEETPFTADPRAGALPPLESVCRSRKETSAQRAGREVGVVHDVAVEEVEHVLRLRCVRRQREGETVSRRSLGGLSAVSRLSLGLGLQLRLVARRDEAEHMRLNLRVRLCLLVQLRLGDALRRKRAPVLAHVALEPAPVEIPANYDPPHCPGRTLPHDCPAPIPYLPRV